MTGLLRYSKWFFLFSLLAAQVACGPGEVSSPFDSSEVGPRDPDPETDAGLPEFPPDPPGATDAGVPVDGGVPGGGGTPAHWSATFRLGTYNVLGSIHTGDGSQVGACGSPPGCVKLRAERAVEVITGNTEGAIGSAVDTAAMDVVGLQELISDQWKIFNTLLASHGYTHYPTTYSQRSIYYRTSRFTLVTGGKVLIPWYGDDGLKAGHDTVWVRLRDRVSGRELTFLNHHPVSWNKDPGSDADGAEKRERTAQIIRQWVIEQRKARPTVPVFVVGDYNSSFVLRAKDHALHGDRARLPYCILTSGGLMRHVVDVLDGKAGTCPTKTGTSHHFRIDHLIYAGAKDLRLIRATGLVRDASSPNITHASDHAPGIADIQLYVPATP